MKNVYFFITGVSAIDSWQYDGSSASNSPIVLGLLQSQIVIFMLATELTNKTDDSSPSAILQSIYNIYVC